MGGKIMSAFLFLCGVVFLMACLSVAYIMRWTDHLPFAVEMMLNIALIGCLFVGVLLIGLGL